jgi:type I restriction enzyme S subunit
LPSGDPPERCQRIGGIPALVVDDLDRVICGYHLALIRPRSHVLLPEFLLYYLQSDSSKRHFLRTAAGLTRFGLASRAISSLPIPLPSLGEQAAIAQLLAALDCALEDSRIALATARRVLRGLLQAAFEFAFSKEPEKHSDAGAIPQSWDAIKGKHAFVIVTGGSSSVDAIRLPRNGEAPDAWFMKVDDFNLPPNRRRIVFTKIGFRAGDNRIFKLHSPGTVVIAKRGAAILKNRVRTTAVPIALDPNLMALAALPGMRPEFLRCQLDWRNLSRYVESSGIPQLNNKDLYPRYFLRAPDDQQQQIIETIAAAEAYEDALVAKMEWFEALRRSLMHDLLTGRVRVKSTTEAVAA